MHDPLQEAAAAGGIQQQRVQQEPSNVWVIRKQMRKKRAGLGSGPAGSDDEIQVLATYFVVGDSVYMAPSVLKIVGSRIVCIQLRKTYRIYLLLIRDSTNNT